MKKVLILGATGMLGNTVAKLFNSLQGFDVYLTYRNKDVAEANFKNISKNINFDCVIDDINSLPKDFDYVINCIGVIKPFMLSDPMLVIYINSLFPWKLATWCNDNNVKMIHITTDCVFSGLRGKYNEIDEHDALDAYGKSKSLGEPISKCMVLRTSIIGEEIHKNASLISWTKTQKGKEVNGYINHFWNGITTNQYAQCIEKIINSNLYENGLFHIHSKNTLSKYEMIKCFNKKFNLDLKILPYSTNPMCDRSLSSLKKLNTILDIPSVEEQIYNL